MAGSDAPDAAAASVCTALLLLEAAIAAAHQARRLGVRHLALRPIWARSQAHEGFHQAMQIRTAGGDQFTAHQDLKTRRGAAAPFRHERCGLDLNSVAPTRPHRLS